MESGRSPGSPASLIIHPRCPLGIKILALAPSAPHAYDAAEVVEFWQKIAFLVLWGAVVLWYVQPVPGKGLPIGRRLFRGYLNGRQAVIWGSFLLVVGLAVVLAGVGAESNDAVLVGACVLWLGLPYVYHGSRMRLGSNASLWETLARRLRPRP